MFKEAIVMTVNRCGILRISQSSLYLYFVCVIKILYILGRKRTCVLHGFVVSWPTLAEAASTIVIFALSKSVNKRIHGTQMRKKTNLTQEEEVRAGVP